MSTNASMSAPDRRRAFPVFVLAPAAELTAELDLPADANRTVGGVTSAKRK